MVKTCTCGTRLFLCVSLQYSHGETSTAKVALRCISCGEVIELESNMRLEYGKQYKIETEDDVIVKTTSDFALPGGGELEYLRRG